MNSSLTERFFNVLLAGIHLGEFVLSREVSDACVSDLLEGIADKFDSIKCGASLKPSSIKKPLGKKNLREKRLKVGKSTPMIHIS